MDPEMAVCPYNNTHIFHKSKLIPHLNRCRHAKFSKEKLMHCKNNFAIVFLEKDKLKHFSQC
jgi:hypothetical protein